LENDLPIKSGDTPVAGTDEYLIFGGLSVAHLRQRDKLPAEIDDYRKLARADRGDEWLDPSGEG
jgi:hypothetical protein